MLIQPIPKPAPPVWLKIKAIYEWLAPETCSGFQFRVIDLTDIVPRDGGGKRVHHERYRAYTVLYLNTPWNVANLYLEISVSFIALNIRNLKLILEPEVL